MSLGPGRWLLDGILRAARYANSLPQGFWWGLVSAIGALSMLFSLLRLHPGKRPRDAVEPDAPSELDQMALLVDVARHGSAARQSLGHRLTEVAAALHARRAGLSPEAALLEIREGHWPLDEAAKSILDATCDAGRRHRMRERAYTQAVLRTLEMLEQYDERGSIADH